MPSSTYNCVKNADVAKLGKAAAQYKRISTPQAVRKAGRQAGGKLRSNMQSLVRGEISLKDHQNVGDAFQVWSDKANVNVGLPPSHPLLDQAQKMDETYQVGQVAFDLAQQSGEVQADFYDRLGLRSRSWWDRALKKMTRR